MKGNPWNEQLKQLKSILNDLSINRNNMVSIVVFDSNFRIEIKNQLASRVDIQKIRFTGGGTSFSEALKGAFECLRDDIGKKYLNLVMISDG